MADWDADSRLLQANLSELLVALRRDARERAKPTVDMARSWHQTMMRGLASPGPDYVGRFRGERRLEGVGVRVANRLGSPSRRVAADLQMFQATLQRAVEVLDGSIKPNRNLTSDQVAAAIDLCAWVHSDWVRIHPFANGNGRTARLWANFIAMRYGLPAFVRLRPRPDGGYAAAAAEAMLGHWQATVPVFLRMYHQAVRRR